MEKETAFPFLPFLTLCKLRYALRNGQTWRRAARLETRGSRLVKTSHTDWTDTAEAGYTHLVVGRDSFVSIATRYKLNGPGIESRWRQDFPHQSRLALGSTQPPIKWVRGLFPRGKAAGWWR